MNKKQTKVVENTIKNFSVRVGNKPGNLMTPTMLANEVVDMGKEFDFEVEVLGEKKMKALGMGLILGVSQGSDEEAKLIVAKYMNGGDEKPTVLVGKGLTFDAGGYSIKPAANLHKMRFDKLGGVAVLSTLRAVAELKLPINLIVVVPASENLINGKATKPGDVHTSMSGLTVSVDNTDAEGRLILADALTYAQEFLNPRSLTTVATLTGAQLFATGTTHTALLGNNGAFIDEMHRAGNEAGDLNWNLPFVQEHSDEMKGMEGYSDLKNIETNRGPGTITAFAFLEAFVDEDIPYTHLDCASTASTGEVVNGRPMPSLVQMLINRGK